MEKIKRNQSRLESQTQSKIFHRIYEYENKNDVLWLPI